MAGISFLQRLSCFADSGGSGVFEHRVEARSMWNEQSRIQDELEYPLLPACLAEYTATMRAVHRYQTRTREDSLSHNHPYRLCVSGTALTLGPKALGVLCSAMPVNSFDQNARNGITPSRMAIALDPSHLGLQRHVSREGSYRPEGAITA